jgi:uncharacterized membrane protein (UPF0136 family)
MMKTIGWILLIFGLFVFSGGWMGYITKQSLPSLISGTAFGIFLVVNALWILIKKEKIVPLYIALLLTFVLDSFFTYRFFEKQQFFPSGLMSLMSLVPIIFLVRGIRQKLKISAKDHSS